MNYLDFVVASQKFGEARGITSVCSAHSFVLEAALRHGLSVTPNIPVLIEATCNQVNQFGGYTGMKPVDFVRFVYEIADRVGFPRHNIILGGDHLGPLVWSNEPAENAMEKAKEMVREYVRAGFRKIHLDCSMPCADDQELPVELIAKRATELTAVAETIAAKFDFKPRYVIGTEVPPAGGAKAGEDHVVITNPMDAEATIDVTHQAFSARGLNSAWERVIATVVQPGVEFGDETIHEYDRSAAVGLARFIETIPGMIYEAHSTDYQSRSTLQSLVEDHFGILKTGPSLTFAFRQAVFALADMEKILKKEDQLSHINEALETAMLNQPVYWQKHYAGASQQQKFARFYSFSDRIRYYWNATNVQTSFEHLLSNLGDAPLPLSLVSEYLPRQYEKIRSKEIENHPRTLLLAQVMDVLENYRFGVSQPVS
ncbi:MAG: class II D-tagatose-bisphosphate aldolase, non-catalytic subunit [Anaerolineales bacterium]|nr:class II D-tagatose-bisphosphate aldolase, non-catalytic subunit [Anaerolineales bacterium]